MGSPLLSRWCLAVLMGIFLATISWSARGAEGISKEYQIKAAFLYNFTKFVEWPSSRFTATNSPIVIGIFGRDPFDGELARIVKGRSVNGRPIEVKNISSPGEALATHLLFISTGEEVRWGGALKSLQKTSVLTVGESSEFVELGGIINFLLEEGKIRFEVNQDAADEAGLKINAQLLKLATTVRRKPKGL